jgi:regulatory protein
VAGGSNSFRPRRPLSSRPGAEEPAGRSDRESEPEGDPIEVARSIGLTMLTASPKSRAQLADAMRDRGVPDEAAVQVLDRFTEVGLIDDVAFAGAWVASRQSGRGLAPRALATELRRKGIADETIADAVALVPDEDVEAQARELIARRLASTARLPAPARIRRLTAFLNRKGYPSQLAFRVVREAIDAEGAGGAGGAEFDAAELGLAEYRDDGTFAG